MVRLKFSLLKASAHRELRDFLDEQLIYDDYKETFAETLEEILQANLQENLEDQAKELASSAPAGNGTLSRRSRCFSSPLAWT
jgi:hypothetical protein